MPLTFAQRLDNVETSAIRELFKLLGKPGIISFAGGFPDSAMFDVAGIQQAVDQALESEPGGALPALGDTLWLIPGHCDPTFNLHDHLIGVRGGLAQGVVECIVAVDARGALT